ncbi:hypothetical protein [Tsuneonella amylolytica]|uniref:hypothetical protein n=1 Tax=Tsuneonella amylolytica TaxID=2338327 RepID=UPI000EAA9F6F|nr:hypothetical protein [Tsuneonella amylolytica]
MTIFVAMMLGAVLLMRTAPNLPVSRALHDLLAVRPAAWILRRSRIEMMAWAIATGILLLGGEYVLVLGGPHAVMAFAVDLAVYVDAFVAVTTLAAAARVQAGTRWLGLRKGRGARPRTKRSASRKTSRRPANDEEDRPAFLRAA